MPVSAPSASGPVRVSQISGRKVRPPRSRRSWVWMSARLDTVRRLAVLVGALVFLGAAPARAGFTDADYWAFADHLATGLEGRWSESRGVYAGERGEAEV